MSSLNLLRQHLTTRHKFKLGNLTCTYCKNFSTRTIPSLIQHQLVCDKAPISTKSIKTIPKKLSVKKDTTISSPNRFSSLANPSVKEITIHSIAAAAQASSKKVTKIVVKSIPVLVKEKPIKKKPHNTKSNSKKNKSNSKKNAQTQKTESLKSEISKKLTDLVVNDPLSIVEFDNSLKEWLDEACNIGNSAGVNHRGNKNYIFTDPRRAYKTRVNTRLPHYPPLDNPKISSSPANPESHQLNSLFYSNPKKLFRIILNESSEGC
ncbi:hypothetical protein HZS_852, partial [Henneguya salminicola]